jgi:hypothetical protein
MNVGGQGQGYIRKQQSAPNFNTGQNPIKRGGPSGGPPSRGGGMFGNAPQRGSHALVPKGPINLITNNFKIRSSNHGIIYTYTVDFIDGENSVVQQALPSTEPSTAASTDKNEETKDPKTHSPKSPIGTNPLGIHTSYSTNHLETF